MINDDLKKFSLLKKTIKFFVTWWHLSLERYDFFYWFVSNPDPFYSMFFFVFHFGLTETFTMIVVVVCQSMLLLFRSKSTVIDRMVIIVVVVVWLVCPMDQIDLMCTDWFWLIVWFDWLKWSTEKKKRDKDVFTSYQQLMMMMLYKCSIDLSNIQNNNTLFSLFIESVSLLNHHLLPILYQHECFSVVHLSSFIIIIILIMFAPNNNDA